jgi:hypothetical protein
LSLRAGIEPGLWSNVATDVEFQKYDTGTELNVFELTQVESSWQAGVAESFQREMQRDGSIMMLPSDN